MKSEQGDLKHAADGVLKARSFACVFQRGLMVDSRSSESNGPRSIYFTQDLKRRKGFTLSKLSATAP